MRIKTSLACFFLLLGTTVLSLAMPTDAVPGVISPPAGFSLDEVSFERPEGGEMVIRMDLQLYVTSDVSIEIRDALGKRFFSTEAVYPEGKQQIRIGVGGLPQGAYFIKVSTELSSQSLMVLIQKS